MFRRIKVALTTTIGIASLGMIASLEAEPTAAKFVPIRCSDGSVIWDKFFRDQYESKIRWGAMKRPPQVNHWEEAFAQAQRYLWKGDQHNASIHLSQAVVILEEKHGTLQAAKIRDQLIKKLGLNSMHDLPTYAKIHPARGLCPVPNE